MLADVARTNPDEVWRLIRAMDTGVKGRIQCDSWTKLLITDTERADVVI